RVERGHAGVVDEDVDLAEAVVGRIDQPFELVPVADMAGNGQGLAAGRRLHLLGYRLAVVELAAGDDHVGPGGRQAEHDLLPEPPAAAGDESDAAGEVEFSHAAYARTSEDAAELGAGNRRPPSYVSATKYRP